MKHATFKKFLVAFGAAAGIGLGGSLLHPYGTAATPGSHEAIFQGAQVGPEMLAIFERACQNCHSERTEWPWYSHVAPMSWLIARDVQQARSQMNLSRWQDYSSDDRLTLLSAIGSAVRNREMPLPRYTLLHSEARLTGQERQQIYQWTRTERRRLAATQSVRSGAAAPLADR
jgi:Haem-binding domain